MFIKKTNIIFWLFNFKIGASFSEQSVPKFVCKHLKAKINIILKYTIKHEMEIEQNAIFKYKYIQNATNYLLGQYFKLLHLLLK